MEMKLHLLALAVPACIFFVLLERYFSQKKECAFYSAAEAVANLNVGIAERLCALLTTGIFTFAFTWVHDHYALFSIPSTPVN